MGAIENEKTYGLKIRESANDGSDFGTPDADYRFLFLGEDGQLHVKDAADAVTDIGSAAPADIVDIPAAETDTTKRLAPDGAGGVAWATGGGGADAAGSFVNARNAATFTSGAATALGFTPTAGNILIAVVTTDNWNVRISTITQTNVTWSRVVQCGYSGGAESLVDVWIGVVAASPGTSVTVTMTGGATIYLAVLEYSGLSACDVWRRYSGGSQTTDDPLLVWPTPGGRVLMAYRSRAGISYTPLPSGWTARAGTPTSVGGGDLWLGDYDASGGDQGVVFTQDVLQNGTAGGQQQTNKSTAMIHLKP
jgi:hypothetical protein